MSQLFLKNTPISFSPMYYRNAMISAQLEWYQWCLIIPNLIAKGQKEQLLPITLFSVCSDPVKLFLFPGCDTSNSFSQHHFPFSAIHFNFQLPSLAAMQLVVLCFFQILPHAKMTWYDFWNISSDVETAEDVLLKCHLPNGALKPINCFPFLSSWTKWNRLPVI